ncbi:DNA mismatch repair protein MutL [Methylobacterium crusticola]|uniref:DNA mismatch repair protein MutL n=1 Tax=Methylobacterium crusticola TaxID=1697972 RepID=A0ABQ4R0D8_9HYPH|nr:ATP-binding protein [Methylobacterium crusticola]GJD51058.1 DNA mismatch repair protein MutL [Methylobacterium crusticola]
MKFEENPPDAASLMMSARSFGNYDLPGALADLIDNSIKGGAREIALTCDFAGGAPEIRIRDDGHGMSGDELRRAMRPASTDPLVERSPDDLGRFGWGMKSASFSQCTRLLVLTCHAGKMSGCLWDLEDVDGWRMGVLEAADIMATASPELRATGGVEIIWSNCDRLSENGSLTVAEFNTLIVHARSRLALIFHRYLAGEVRGRRLTIRLNGHKVEAWDPFYRDHEATQVLEPENLEIGGRAIDIQPFILPHYSKLKTGQYDKLGGEEGFLRNQGFYVYRSHRLIISGTWFRLVRHGELSQLVRIRVDIPNALDHIWKITIDKSDAQLPAALRTRLRQIVEGLRRRSAKVFRSRGGRLDRTHTTSVWSRYSRGGEIHYAINREHPIIEALLDSGDGEQQRAASAAIRVIEQAFPVQAFGQDAAANIDAIHQTLADPEAFRADLLAALPLLLAQVNGDLTALEALLRSTEPWCEAWNTTESVLKEKGWMRAKSQ